jgi:hypothetical protein
MYSSFESLKFVGTIQIPPNRSTKKLHPRPPHIKTTMYTLDTVDFFQISDPTNAYIYDIVPVAAGLAAISSDDSLRLLDPLALNGTPLNSIRRVNTDVTCLKAVNNTAEGDALIVCTAGRDGRVCLLDPRTSAKIGEVRTGALGFHFAYILKLIGPFLVIRIAEAEGRKFFFFFGRFGKSPIGKYQCTFPGSVGLSFFAIWYFGSCNLTTRQVKMLPSYHLHVPSHTA